MKLSDFTRHSTESHLYVSGGVAALGYSDGEGSERQLADVMARATDLSETSLELRRAQVDWPSTYHLTAERGNLLRWFPFRAGMRVLEIGAGCGAISRFLGERGVELHAVEGAPVRAQLAARRCRDLENVRIYAGNVQDISSEPTFDMVTLIGVLEYAGRYVRAEDPWLALLQHAHAFLKDGGVLAVAIENKIGLKYWAGCSEDHGAGHFASLHGYPAGNDIQTFSRPELESLLTRAGLGAQKFFFPWPDYKIPTVVMNEPACGVDIANWVPPSFADYSGNKQPLLNERLLLRTIDRAGLLGDLANSFLVLASDRPLSTEIVPTWQARAYAVNRARAFCTETTFHGPGEPVSKRTLWPEPPCAAPVAFRPAASSWHAGPLLEHGWVESLVAGDAARFFTEIRRYRDVLRTCFGRPESDRGVGLLDGRALDCLPRNVVVGPDECHPFDLEWVWQDALPEDRVVWRALWDFAFRYHAWMVPLAPFARLDPAAIVVRAMQEIYPSWDATQAPKLLAFELAFQDVVARNACPKTHELWSLSGPTQPTDALSSMPAPVSAAFDATIIVPVFNNRELTQQCLTALAEVTDGATFDVVVVDNGSTDDTETLLTALSGDVQIIRNRENLGFARACNQGAAVAKGRHLVFLNNDTIPKAGWLRALVAEADAHTDVAVVGSKLLYPDGTIQHAGMALSRDTLQPYHLFVGQPGDAEAVSCRREHQAVTAACVLVRREWFEALGGFDEAYRNGYEDVDLCLRIGERGGRVVYQPESVLIHLESRTPGRQDHDGQNATRYRERWGAQWWRADEDVFHVAAGVTRLVEPDGPGTVRIHHAPVTDPTEHAAWTRVAELQALLRRQDFGAAGRVLRETDRWPNDPRVLLWCTTVAQRLAAMDPAATLQGHGAALPRAAESGSAPQPSRL